MKRAWIVVVWLAFALGMSAVAQDTSYVTCWNGEPKGSYHAQRVRGQVQVSAEGTKAYVSVTASTTPAGGCTNMTHLYIARTKSEYRAMYEGKPHDAYNGNGMRLLGWSGHRLLASATDWVYHSNAAPYESVVIFDEASGEAQLYDTTALMSNYFGGKCALAVSLRGWEGPESLLLKVSAPGQLMPTEQACVSSPALYSVRLTDGAVREIGRDAHN